MSLKTIKVNPIFLMGAGGGSGKGEKNKTRKEKPLGVSLGQPNNIKKKLIARIKNFQQEKTAGSSISNSKSISNNADTSSFMNEFSESVNFLDNLARDKQVKRNATLKKKQPHNPEAYMQIATELPPELMGVITPTPPLWESSVPDGCAKFAPKGGVGENPPKGGVGQAQQVATHPWSAPPQPLYSNLKMGGTKPTYRTWLRNTQKNKHVQPPTKLPINILEDFAESIVQEPPAPAPPAPPAHASVALASVALAQTAATLSIQTEPIPTVSITAEPIQTQPLMVGPALPPNGGPALPPNGGPACVAGGARPRRKKITRTLKYKLGKHANGKVSVLIKNSQTRRRVQTEHSLLKQKSILDIKNYLRSKNLLKVGSEAPNDVLRHLYEQSILAGQIENKAKDTLIHNYFNTEK
jgi:hypothetical protein